MTEATINYEIPKYGDINRLYFTSNINDIVKLMLDDNANGLCFVYIDINNKCVHIFYGYKYIGFGVFKNNPTNLLSKISLNPYFSIPPKEFVTESGIVTYIEGIFKKNDKESKPKLYILIEDMVGGYIGLSYKYQDGKLIKFKDGTEVSTISNNNLLVKSYTNKDIPNMPELNGLHDPGDAKSIYISRDNVSNFGKGGNPLDIVEDFLVYINMFRDIIPPLYDSINRHIKMIGDELEDIYNITSKVITDIIRENNDNSPLFENDYVEFTKREFLDEVIDYVKSIDNNNITEKARARIIENLYKVELPDFRVIYPSESIDEVNNELETLKNDYKNYNIYKLYKENGEVFSITGRVCGNLNSFRGELEGFVYNLRNYVRDSMYNIYEYLNSLTSSISFEDLEVYSSSDIQLKEDYYQIKKDAFDCIVEYILSTLPHKLNDTINEINEIYENKSEYLSNLDIPNKDLGILYSINEEECSGIEDDYIKSICQNMEDYIVYLDELKDNLTELSSISTSVYDSYTVKESDECLSSMNINFQSFKGSVQYTKLKNDITGYTTDVFEKPQQSNPNDNKLIPLVSKKTIDNNKHVVLFVEARHNVDIGTAVWVFNDDTYPYNGILGTGNLLYGRALDDSDVAIGISAFNEKLFWCFEIIYDYGVVYRIMNKTGEVLSTNVANLPNNLIDVFVDNILVMYGSLWKNGAYPYRNEFSFLCNVDIFSEYSSDNFEYSLDKYMKRKFESSPEIFFSKNTPIEELYNNSEITNVSIGSSNSMHLTDYNYDYNSLIIDCYSTSTIFLCDENDVRVSQNDFNFSLDIKFTNKVPVLNFMNSKTLSIHRIDFSEAELDDNFYILHESWFEIKETTFVFKNKEQFSFFISKIQVDDFYNMNRFTNCTFIFKEENKTITGTFIIDDIDGSKKLFRLKDSSFLQTFSFKENRHVMNSYFTQNFFIDFTINDTENSFSSSIFDGLDVYYNASDKTLTLNNSIVFNNVGKDNRLILVKDVITNYFTYILNGEKKESTYWTYTFWAIYRPLYGYAKINKIAMFQNLTTVSRNWSWPKLEDELILKPLQEKRLKEQEEYFNNPVDYCVDDML